LPLSLDRENGADKAASLPLKYCAGPPVDRSGGFPATHDLVPEDSAQDEPYLATIAKRFSALALRDTLHRDGPPSLSEQSGPAARGASVSIWRK